MDFLTYCEAIGRWLIEQGKEGVALSGDGFDNLTLVWNNLDEQIPLDDVAIQRHYEQIVVDRQSYVPVDIRVDELEEENALVQEVLAFTATRLDELNELDDDLSVLQDVLAFYVGVN